MDWKKNLALAMGALTSMASGALAPQAAAAGALGLRSQRARRYVRRRQISMPFVVDAGTDQHLEATVRLGQPKAAQYGTSSEKSGLYPAPVGANKASSYPGCEAQTTTVRLFGGELTPAGDPRTACDGAPVCDPEDGTDTANLITPIAVRVVGAEKSDTYAEAGVTMERQGIAVFVFDFAELGITEPTAVSVEITVEPNGEGDFRPCETASLESTLFISSNEGARTAIPTGRIDQFSLKPQKYWPTRETVR